MGVLTGRTAIVTGAARGIGRGIALALGKEGASLVLVDLREEQLAATARELSDISAPVETSAGDVSDQSVVDHTISLAKRAFGQVDILVNNAQVVEGGVLFADHQDRHLEMCLNSGLWGTFRFMRACYPEMKGRGGSIVNIASPSGTHGLTGNAGYAAAKEGIRGLTKVGATEWGPDGITVNCICPQAATDLSLEFWATRKEYHDRQVAERPMRRDGDPEADIGRLVVFLVGPDSTFITGMTMMANGGSTIYP